MALAIFAALNSMPASAQGASATPPASAKKQTVSLATIQVIGSKIKGVDMESSVPIQIITHQQIEASNATTLDEVLQTMAISGDARNRTSESNQISFANLRGIGFGRTLVLVNGHRWVGSSDLNGSVDLSSIPLSAIERIEVLKDGGSVLYGADAMVGLINVVLKDHYDGAEAKVSYGNYQHGEGSAKKAQLTIGHSSGRFSGLLSFMFNKEDGINYDDYALTRQHAPIGSGSTKYSDYTPAGNFELCSGKLNAAGGCSARALTDPGGAKGTPFVYDPNLPGLYRTYNGPGVEPTDSYNDVGYRYLLTPLTQKSIVGNMSYQITDDIKFNLAGQFMDVSASKHTPPIPLNLGARGSAAGKSIFISPKSYYNPYGSAIGFVRRELTEAGAESYDYDTKTKAISPTLSGDFGIGNRDFDWEAGAEFGSTYQITHNLNDISVSKLKNALGPSFKDANGNIVCGTPGNTIAGCVPLNILGSGTVTQGMLNYIQIVPSFYNYFTDRDYFAQISSDDLLELPAGELGFAAGFERHSVFAKTGRDAAFDNNDVLSQSRGVISGAGYGSNDTYAEFYVPVLSGLPGIQQLNLDIAGRHSAYDSGVGVNNGKLGLKWKVTNDFALRGSISTGYRLDLAGIIQNTQYSTVRVTDPCSFTTDTKGKITSNRYAALSAAQMAQCSAVGVPAGGYDTRLAPQTTQLSTGNKKLGPEKDLFRTYGFVYSPHFIPGLDITLDYWDVKFRDSIVAPTDNQFVLNCLSNPGDPKLCPNGWVQRDANGAVTFVQHSKLNGAGGERYTGYDFNLRYRFTTSNWGKFQIELDNALLTRVIDKNALRDVPGSADFNKVGVYTTGTTSAFSHYHLRSNLNLDWSRGAWGAHWGIRYYSSQKENCRLVSTTIVGLCNDLGPLQNQGQPGFDPTNPATFKYLPFMGGGSANRVGAYAVSNVSVYYSPTPTSRIKFGINNVFDKQPPFFVNSGRSYNPSFGIPDRYFTLEYSMKLL
ncbi:MAG: hypothetical protein EPN68_03140 [Rhodanobacter sp.]|nr:MAG: hypothetical protein EPN68_03140 [Rhodanobacter sp.]